MPEEDEDRNTYTVVINHEEQYSIWPDGRDLPTGWTAVGVTGPKQHCLDHIEIVWTDMRPLSLRRAMAAQAAGGGSERSEG
jgi:MbtH protein